MRLARISIIIALVSCYALLQPVAGQAPGCTATPAPDHLTLTWTGDPATTMTVTWRTDTTVTAGIVKYQEGNELTDVAQETKAEATEFKSDLGTARIFSATLSNLSPDTSYSYQVGDGSRWSETHSFKTASGNAKSFKFLVFGDSQSSVGGSEPYGEWGKTLHNAFAANRDAAFFVNVGDLVDYGQSEAHWDAWFAASKGVVDTIPVMAVSGNHEAYGMRQIGRPQFFLEQFTFPRNGPALLPEQAYSFNYGPVHLVMLDSQGLEQQKFNDILSIQQSWLESDLRTSDGEWKIAFFHRSPYAIKAGRDEAEVREAFCPILERYGVQFVFTGHDHGIERTFPLKNDAPVEDPLKGTTYFITGRSGAKTYSDIAANKYSAFFYAPLDQPNYLVVEGTDREITVRTVLQDGRVIDTYSIEKPKSAGQ